MILETGCFSPVLLTICIFAQNAVWIYLSAPARFMSLEFDYQV